MFVESNQELARLQSLGHYLYQEDKLLVSQSVQGLVSSRHTLQDLNETWNGTEYRYNIPNPCGFRNLMASKVKSTCHKTDCKCY